MVPEAQYPEALSIQVAGAPGILSLQLAVLSAIHLDHQSGLQACEICNERANRMLPPELVTEHLSRPQMPPQPLLRIGHLRA